MSRDPRLLQRLYGNSVPPRFEAGPSLAIWSIGLLLAAAGSAVLSVVSLVAANTPDATTVQLESWGVLGPDEPWQAVHLDNASGTHGCALTASTLVRWEQERPVETVALEAATIEPSPTGVLVTGVSTSAFCPTDPGSDSRIFVSMLVARTDVIEPWRPGPDPRVAHLFAGP